MTTLEQRIIVTLNEHGNLSIRALYLDFDQSVQFMDIANAVEKLVLSREVMIVSKFQNDREATPTFKIAAILATQSTFKSA